MPNRNKYLFICQMSNAREAEEYLATMTSTWVYPLCFLVLASLCQSDPTCDNIFLHANKRIVTVGDSVFFNCSGCTPLTIRIEAVNRLSEFTDGYSDYSIAWHSNILTYGFSSPGNLTVRCISPMSSTSLQITVRERGRKRRDVKMSRSVHQLKRRRLAGSWDSLRLWRMKYAKRS